MVSAAGTLAESVKDGKIVHGCGNFHGVRHANCKESLKRTIREGRTAVEIDFMFTSDNVLICEHGYKTYGREV